MSKQKILLDTPIALVKQIEQFQAREMISTRTGAILELIKRGLKVSDLRER